MSKRPTRASLFDFVRNGISGNDAAMLAAQAQLSSGKRILRPSDDAIGTVLSLSLLRQSSVVEGDQVVNTLNDGLLAILSSDPDKRTA